MVQKPIIRIVFALATREAGVRNLSLRAARGREPHNADSFTASDVWIWARLTVPMKIWSSYRILLEHFPLVSFEFQDQVQDDGHHES